MMMLRIKTFCIAAVMVACIDAIYAQNLICPDIEQNGTIYGFDHVFTDPSPLKFVLADWSVKGEWSVGILNRDGEYDDTEFETENSWNCIFNPVTVAKQLRASPRMYDDSDDRRFFKVRISFRIHDGVEDHRYIRLKLVPTKPILSDINFNCVYENDEDFRYGYPTEGKNMFSFTAKSPNAKKMIVHYAEGSYWPYFGEEDNIYYLLGWYAECNNGIAIINEDWINWGAYIVIEAENDFGYSPYCDPILTTWYITDQDILARIEELRQHSALDHPDADKNTPHVVWQHNAVRSDTELRTLSVYDMLGSLCGQYHNVSSVDLSHLRRGVYVVVYELSGNQSGKLKIVKQ